MFNLFVCQVLCVDTLIFNYYPYNNIGLNMFLVPQVSATFEFSPSSKLLTNLVLHLSKCVNLVLLTKFC